MKHERLEITCNGAKSDNKFEVYFDRKQQLRFIGEMMLQLDLFKTNIKIPSVLVVNDIKFILENSPFYLKGGVEELIQMFLVCNNEDCLEQFTAYGEPGQGFVIPQKEPHRIIEDNGRCCYCGSYCHIIE